MQTVSNTEDLSSEYIVNQTLLNSNANITCCVSNNLSKKVCKSIVFYSGNIQETVDELTF